MNTRVFAGPFFAFAATELILMHVTGMVGMVNVAANHGTAAFILFCFGWAIVTWR